MSEWLDGRLSSDGTAALSAHVEHCPACRSHWEAMQHVSLLLERVTMATPGPQFTARVMQRVQEQARQPLVVRPLALARVWAAAFTVLVTGGLFSLMTWPGTAVAESLSFDLVGLSMAVSGTVVQAAQVADSLVSIARLILSLLPWPLLVLGLVWGLAGTAALLFTLIQLLAPSARPAMRAHVQSHPRVGWCHKEDYYGQDA